jgi:hypothetical protein
MVESTYSKSTAPSVSGEEDKEETYHERIMRELKETRARAAATLERSAALKGEIE